MGVASAIGPWKMEAANKNVWLEAPVETKEQAQNYATCMGCTEGFQASTYWPYGESWSWSGATRTTPATEHPSGAQRTFTSSGTYSVTATYHGESANAVYVEALNVTSFTPSEGTLIAGSSPPTYVVCLGVVVTATSTPSIAENLLPGCWGFVGERAGRLGTISKKRKQE